MPRNTSALLWWKRIAAGFVIACVLMDLLPRHGAPEFRYTGPDPAHEVWNLGWPVTLTIYDPESGMHLGPVLYPVVAVQAMLAFVIAVVLFFQGRHHKTMQRTGAIASAS